ncbi:hypothetical protein ABOZ73_05500 [Caulobacter sp. 73W]|uniref:Uncharacterized protein n=1 Tax=Caulobacter sp. 73W TaxID=3161137 RepID=A0AB39KVW0_9CAUL
MIRALLPLLISTALALPAAAQEAPPPQPDEEAAEAAPAPQPQIERPYEAAPAAEVGPVYDARVQGRIGAAQSQRGRLDGGWILSDQAGARLYALQFSQTTDSGLEGAWRDLRRGGVSTLGVMDELTEAGGEVVAILPGKDPTTPTRLVLRPDADGWAGEMREDGSVRAVMARRDPISAAWDSYTPGSSTRPFVAGAPAAKAAPAKATVKRKAPVKRRATAKRGKGKRRR